MFVGIICLASIGTCFNLKRESPSSSQFLQLVDSPFIISRVDFSLSVSSMRLGERHSRFPGHCIVCLWYLFYCMSCSFLLSMWMTRSAHAHLEIHNTRESPHYRDAAWKWYRSPDHTNSRPNSWMSQKLRWRLEPAIKLSPGINATQSKYAF